MRELSLPIPASVQGEGFLAVPPAQRSGNTRTRRSRLRNHNFPCSAHYWVQKRSPGVTHMSHYW